MSILIDFLKNLRSRVTGDSQSISLDADVDVETHKHEAQGIGKKIVAKDNSSLNIDCSTNIINLTINDIPTDRKGRAELVSLMREAFNNKEICLVSETANATVQDYNQNPIEDSAKAAMEYMATIAPESDVLCMETGLYVRSLDRRGKTEVAKQVQDRASKTPRARNIINLASAGFIEDYVVPVCQAGGDNARKIYNDIVEDLPGFVFVNAAMGVSDTMKLVEKKMNDRIKYHWEISSISVNGLNSCVDTIKKARDEIKNKYPDLKVSYIVTEEPSLIRGELKIIFENGGKNE